jgi:hypothetical protein
MEHFTAVAVLVGDRLIGLSPSVPLLFGGMIAGVDGIVGGLLSPAQEVLVSNRAAKSGSRRCKTW